MTEPREIIVIDRQPLTGAKATAVSYGTAAVLGLTSAYVVFGMVYILGLLIGG